MPNTHSNDIVTKIINYEEGNMTEDEVINFFQELKDSGTINGLQGSYQRMARNLFEAGLIK